MKLEKLLLEKRSDILKKWLQMILETYPGDAQRFLKEQKDPFANPVRHTFEKETEHVFHELMGRIDPKRVVPFLDKIICIRAIQDFTASQAVSFIFLLKRVIRELLEGEIREKGLTDDLSVVEARIDELALLSFDIYMRRKEKLYQLRANEAETRVSGLLKRAGLICEIPEWQPDAKEGTLLNDS